MPAVVGSHGRGLIGGASPNRMVLRDVARLEAERCEGREPRVLSGAIKIVAEAPGAGGAA